MAQKFFISILFFLLNLNAGPALAMTVDVGHLRKGPDANAAAEWTFSYTEDAREISDLTDAAVNSPDGRTHLVVVAHEGDKIPLTSKDIQQAPDAVIEYDLHGDASAPAEAGTEEKASSSKSERRMALLVATAQTAASTFSFLYFSEGPMPAAAASAVVCGILNFYFSWDPSRWGRFLEWGDRITHKAMDRLGLKNLKSRTSSKLARVFTGAVGAVGMSFMYGGILAWQSFMDSMVNPVFLTTVTVNGLIGSFYTGIWDSVFIQWERSKQFSGVAIRNIWRFKNLFSAFLSPIIYIGLGPAKVIAISSGVAAAVALWKSEPTGRLMRNCARLLGQR